MCTAHFLYSNISFQYTFSITLKDRVPSITLSVGSEMPPSNAYFSWDMLSNVFEYICYSGSLVSAMIAVRLLKMGNLDAMTFYNKMFILYFGIDSINGFLEEYFLFRLREDRSWP